MKARNKVLRVLYALIILAATTAVLCAQNKIVITGGSGGVGGASIDSVYKSNDSLVIVEGGVVINGPVLGAGGIAIIQNVQPNDSSHNDILKSGWNTITLNTERYDDIGLTITGDSIFTLPAGRYIITTAYATIWYKFRVYDVTNDQEYASTNFGVLGSSSALFTPVTAAVNLSSDTDFKYQIISNSGGARIIEPDSYAGEEIFAQVTIIKL